MSRPLWIASLTRRVAIGAPWVINPLLTGLTALGVYRFAAAVYGEPIGRASGVLFALSPFVLFVGASQMNHVLTLAGVVLALVGLVRWDRGGGGAASAWGAALVGAGIGVAAATRPYDAVAVSVAIAAHGSPALSLSPSKELHPNCISDNPINRLEPHHQRNPKSATFIPRLLSRSRVFLEEPRPASAAP